MRPFFPAFTLALHALWTDIRDDARTQPYEEKAKADKERYEKEKAAYDVRLLPDSPSSLSRSFTCP